MDYQKTKNLLMKEFLMNTIEEYYKPQPGKVILKSIMMTALMNLITLPLGWMFASIPGRYKSKETVYVDLETKLYEAFSTGLLDDADLRRTRAQAKEEYIAFLNELSTDQKIKILNMALQFPKEYLDFVHSDLWQQKKAA